MNQNYNDNQVSGAGLVKKFFTRTSFLTVTIASAILSALIIFQTVISVVSDSKLNMLASIYYLFDNQNTAIINAVFGVIVCIASILFFMSFLSIYLKSVSSDPEPPASGFSLLTISSIIYIAVSCITVIFAFASISVLRYESYQNSLTYDYREFTKAPNTYSLMQANYDLFVYFLFGAAAIILGISAVRVSLAIKKVCKGEEIPTTRGGALFLIGSIASLSMTIIAFFTSLGNLVIPDVNSTLKPLDLLTYIINVLIYASAAAILLGLAFLYSNYSSLINKIYQRTPSVTSYYAGYATNVYPTNAVRPPMPPVTPYIQTRNQFYNAKVQQRPPVYTQQPVQPPMQPQQPITPAEPQVQTQQPMSPVEPQVQTQQTEQAETAVQEANTQTEVSQSETVTESTSEKA